MAENSKLWQLLVHLAEYEEGWDKFSNDKDGKRDAEVSLESWHDNFHNLLGGGRGSSGNMASTAIAGVSLSRRLFSASITAYCYQSSTPSSGSITGNNHPFILRE